MREELLKKLVRAAEEGTAPVFDIAVMDDGGISVANPTRGAYANDSYSVAKAFIAAAALILFDRGKLTPDTKVKSLLGASFPEGYDEKWDDVTVAHCITHRMGVGSGFLDIDVEDQLNFGDDWLRYSFGRRLKYAPGEHNAYSDGAYYILSRMVEEAAGQETSEFIADNITKPLEFRETAWSRCPQHHIVGATGFYASAEDIVKLGWLFTNEGKYKDHQIISPETMKMALERGYGLTSPSENRKIYWKGGMYEQMVIASPVNRCAVAWHSFTAGTKNLLAGVALDALS